MGNVESATSNHEMLLTVRFIVGIQATELILHKGNVGNCLDVPWDRRNLRFPHRVPFTKEKIPWCPCPFKK